MAIDISRLTLVVPEKSDPERNAVGRGWEELGGNVHRLAKFWRPPAMDPATVRVYGPDTFALVFAQILGLKLLEPAQDIARHIPERYFGRRTWIESLDDVHEQQYPLFVKPLVPKQFAGKVFACSDDLAGETAGIEGTELVFASEPVNIEAEARVFLLDRQVLDAALYEGEGRSESAKSMAAHLASEVDLPRAVVLDFGLIPGNGWVFIEANAAWGAGLNGCDPSLVLPAIAAATTYPG